MRAVTNKITIAQMNDGDFLAVFWLGHIHSAFGQPAEQLLGARLTTGELTDLVAGSRNTDEPTAWPQQP